MGSFHSLPSLPRPHGPLWPSFRFSFPTGGYLAQNRTNALFSEKSGPSTPRSEVYGLFSDHGPKFPWRCSKGLVPRKWQEGLLTWTHRSLEGKSHHILMDNPHRAYTTWLPDGGACHFFPPVTSSLSEWWLKGKPSPSPPQKKRSPNQKRERTETNTNLDLRKSSRSPARGEKQNCAVSRGLGSRSLAPCPPATGAPRRHWPPPSPGSRGPNSGGPTFARPGPGSRGPPRCPDQTSPPPAAVFLRSC